MWPARPLMSVGRETLWPFGRKLVSRISIDKYREKCCFSAVRAVGKYCFTILWLCCHAVSKSPSICLAIRNLPKCLKKHDITGISHLFLFSLPAGEDATWGTMSSVNLCPPSVFRCSLFPSDEWKEAHMDLPGLWQARSIWAPHYWWVRRWEHALTCPAPAALSVNS